MQPDDQSLLVDMLLAAREARELAKDCSVEEFLDDRLLQLAMERLVQNIGEAAGHLSPRAHAMLPALPWEDTVGMRHRLVHAYRRVDLAKVWEVVAEDLNPLIAAIDPLAASSRPEDQ